MNVILDQKFQQYPSVQWLRCWPLTLATQVRVQSGPFYILYFQFTFELYVTIFYRRFPVKMSIFTIQCNHKKHFLRENIEFRRRDVRDCLIWLIDLVKAYLTYHLQLRPIGFEKAEILRVFLPMKVQWLKLKTLTNTQHIPDIAEKSRMEN